VPILETKPRQPRTEFSIVDWLIQAQLLVVSASSKPKQNDFCFLDELWPRNR
jgi:hypothetical protein